VVSIKKSEFHVEAVEFLEYCNDSMIGSYNNYHQSTNGMPSGNQK